MSRKEDLDKGVRELKKFLDKLGNLEGRIRTIEQTANELKSTLKKDVTHPERTKTISGLVQGLKGEVEILDNEANEVRNMVEKMPFWKVKDLINAVQEEDFDYAKALSEDFQLESAGRGKGEFEEKEKSKPLDKWSNED